MQCISKLMIEIGHAHLFDPCGSGAELGPDFCYRAETLAVLEIQFLAALSHGGSSKLGSRHQERTSLLVDNQFAVWNACIKRTSFDSDREAAVDQRGAVHSSKYLAPASADRKDVWRRLIAELVLPDAKVLARWVSDRGIVGTVARR
jgi:hypothetical protein